MYLYTQREMYVQLENFKLKKNYEKNEAICSSYKARMQVGLQVGVLNRMLVGLQDRLRDGRVLGLPRVEGLEGRRFMGLLRVNGLEDGGADNTWWETDAG